MMKKKFFAVALATTMAVSTVMTAAAETKDVDIAVAFGDNTGNETLTGDFDITYTFNNATKNTSANWNNFILEIFDEEGQFLTLRADAYGWTAGNWTLGGDAWTDGENHTHPSFVLSSEDWTTWATVMEDADVTVNVKRTDNVFNVQYDMKGESTSYQFKTTAVINEAVSDTLKIHLTGENVTLTNVKFTDNTKASAGKDDSTVETPSTGEDGATVETPSASDTKKDDTTAPSEKEDTTKNPSASTDDSVVSPSPKPDDSVVSPSPKPGDSVVSPSPTPGTVTPTGSTVTPGTTTPTGSTYVPATTVDDKQDSVSNVKSEERENVEKNAKIEGLEAAGLPADTQLRVSNILKTDASYTSAVSFLEKSYLNKDYVLVDLTLNSPTEGAKSGQLKSKIKVTLPVFKALEKASKVDIYRYDSETNTYVKVDSSAVTDGNITFETDHFTPYLFVEANAETPSGNNDATTATKATNTTNTDKSNSPKTGDSTTAAVFGFTAMASVAAILASKKKFAK